MTERGAGGKCRNDRGEDPGGDAWSKIGRRSCRCGVAVATRGHRQRQRLKGGGGGSIGEVLVAEARSGGGCHGGSGGTTEACGGGDRGWTPSSAFREQPLEMEETPFFSQMTARVCGGVPSPLIEPIMGREGKGPT